MRELTLAEARIAHSRYVEVQGSTHHQGLWFLGEVKTTDTRTEPTTFDVRCYRCGTYHSVEIQQITHIGE